VVALLSEWAGSAWYSSLEVMVDHCLGSVSWGVNRYRVWRSVGCGCALKGVAREWV
jgi:hypothetical protein